MDFFAFKLTLFPGQKATSPEQRSRLNPLGVIHSEGSSKAKIVADIVRTIYARDGIRGYYRGYMASFCTYVPSSACWWTFYHFFRVWPKLIKLII